MRTDEDWPEQSKMRRRSHAIVRGTLILVCLLVAEETLPGRAGWPPWLRYGAYAVVVLLVLLLFPRPDWPDEDSEEVED